MGGPSSGIHLQMKCVVLVLLSVAVFINGFASQPIAETPIGTGHDDHIVPHESMAPVPPIDGGHDGHIPATDGDDASTSTMHMIDWLCGFTQSCQDMSEVRIGDSVHFTWDSSAYGQSHDLWLTTDKDAYDSCDIDSIGQSGTQLVELTETGVYHLDVPSAGPWYFVCSVQSHCQAGQKLEIPALM